MNAPRVSIVIATYNSTHYLRHAIASVMRSDFDDWELIVIGDHCTDDTAECVAGFNDPRISFYNLPENSGQQAKPNNAGVGRARGRYLCFLNHDDMFMPNHLSSMLRELDKTGADIICARYAIIRPFDPEHPPSRLRARNGGATPEAPEFTPLRGHIASTWFMRREVAEEVGPWKMERETYVTPSQEWLFRAWSRGKRILCTRTISVIALHCGHRKDAYRKKSGGEHQYVFHAMTKPGFLEQVLASIEEDARSRKQLRRMARWCFELVFGRLAMALGFHPRTPEMILRYGGRGGFIRRLKRFTG